MPFGNQEINSFKKRIKRFSELFPKYREFVNLVNFIDSFLTPEQKQTLEFKYKEIVIDFKTQLLFYFEDRYDSGFSLEELKEKSKKTFSKYSFLFDTCLDSNQIRVILLRELMEVISIGSQCFHYRRLSVVNGDGFDNLFDDGISPSRSINFMRREIMERYPNLPNRTEEIYKKNFEFYFFQEFFWRGYDLIFSLGETLKEEWKNEFFKKTKWFFEQLNSCEEEYRNKYREKIYQEVCYSTGVDRNCSHIYIKPIRWFGKFSIVFFWFPWKKLYIGKNEHINIYLEEIINTILSFFEEKELNNFLELDSKENNWNFQEQLFDKYYSKYPSFVSLDVLKNQIKKTVFKYKSLFLIKEQTKIVKEIFMNELEQELFISKFSHDCNKEMIGNLCILKNKKINYRTKWAIDQIIKIIGSENIKKLSLKIEEKEYDLKTLLIARWGRAWLVRGKNYFKTRLLLAFIKNDLNKGITNINFQTVLEELDSCFLYPKTNRIKKILLRKDGTEDISKWRKNIWTLYVDLNKKFDIPWFIPIIILCLFCRFKRENG